MYASLRLNSDLKSCLWLPFVRRITGKLTLIKSNRMKDKEMKARSELKKKISEIFKEFMTGITKLEELGNVANTFLLRFQQGLSSDEGWLHISSSTCGFS